ncbi:MAG: glutaminyl-peptide cyclotransferase [Deltaproteobacteria bacterium]|nr:glutaminyl-peptide cyclotransferase [Deltaproteobacteria bacterium]
MQPKLLFLLAIAGVSCIAGKLELIGKIPHSGYSEGLDYYQGYLWHALPKMIVKIDPKDGTVLARYQPASEYSESIAWLDGKLWNLSYSDNGIYKGVFDRNRFNFLRVGSTPEKHGWGLTHDGQYLIMTGNYSSKIYFVDPVNLKVVRTLTTLVKDLEDLAWDGRQLWASSFTQHRGHIFSISPTTGAIGELFGLPDPEACPVVDGVAYSPEGLWVTGKDCPSIYLFRKPSERAITAK